MNNFGSSLPLSLSDDRATGMVANDEMNEQSLAFEGDSFLVRVSFHVFSKRITSCEKTSVWNLKILSNAIIYFYRILKAGSRLRSLSFISGGRGLSF